MKTKIHVLLFTLAVCCVMLVLSLPAFAANGTMQGDGSPGSPYRIEDYADLKEFARKVNEDGYESAWAVLTKDITATDKTWTPIGDGKIISIEPDEARRKYSGTFDGRGHNITSLDNSENTESEYNGLFGYVFVGIVKNVGMVSGYIKGVYGVGGIVGHLDSGTVQQCFNTGKVEGRSNVGGIVGYSMNSTSKIENCYNTGNVSGNNPVIGGIVGYLANGLIKYCYNAGKVTGKGIVGSIVGKYVHGTVDRAYYLKGTTDKGIGEGDDDTTVLTKDEFKLRSSFSEWEDFDSVWYMTDTSPMLWLADMTGSGTKDSPYEIASADHWNALRRMIENGGKTEGMYFKQTADISVTEMIGSKDHPFKGVYDGGGHTLTFNYTTDKGDCAPFRYIRNATVQNLHTDGTINTSYKWAAGIAADAFETCKIINCRSSVTINASRDGDGSHAGILAVTLKGYDNNVTIKGCVFDGKLLGPKTKKCGGIAGPVSGTVVLEDCLFLPSELTVKSDGSENFARAEGTAFKIENCYYHDKYFSGSQGAKSYSVTAEDGTELGFGDPKAEYPADGITVYAAGIKYNGVLYAGQGETVIISASGNEGICEAAASAGTIKKDGDKFTLTMPAQNVVLRVRLFGDVDADGSVTPKDAMILSRYLARWSGYEKQVSMIAADVDVDGNVTVRDAIILARHLAGWEGFKTLPYKK